MAHAAKWINAKSTESVTEVAARSLKSRLDPIQQLLPLAALQHQDSVEYVHNLRVWTRRADAAVDMYRDLLPDWRAAWIEKQLKRIRQATNDARDDDVLERRLLKDESPAAANLLKRVRERRVASQKPIREVYEQLTKKRGRFQRRVEKLMNRVRVRGPHRKSKEPTYRDWAISHLRPILTEFFETATSNLEDTESLHRFRIAGKRLRYAVELLAAAFESDLKSSVYPLLETLQDQLGRINDHASALGRIGQLIDDDGDDERRQYLITLLALENQQLIESRREFSRWWSVERQEQLRSIVEAEIKFAGHITRS